MFGGLKGRRSDSPYVEQVQTALVSRDGTTIRPAEIHWHLVLARHRGEARLVLVGPWTGSGVVTVPKGAEILWIKLKLGAFMPHLPTHAFRDSETTLPEASDDAFWLHGSAWQFPSFENADTFAQRLVAEGVLAHDSLVNDVLRDHPPDLSPRTIRHRFLRATGLTRNQVRQFERARHAAALLRQGVSILDTGFDAGYYDQPHLTRSLKHWIGHTPAEILRATTTTAIAD